MGVTMLAVLVAAVFTGDTSNPDCSCFAIGKPAKALFSAKEFVPSSTQRLEARLFDAEDRELSVLADRDETIAADGTWSGEVDLPTGRYGFFRVRATLGGLKLPKVGSRPEGCLTYVVAPDPKDRPLYGEHDHFLGLHGGAGGDAYLPQWLGARRILRGIGPYLRQEDYEKEKAKSDARGWTYYGFYSPQASHLRWSEFVDPADRDWMKANGKDQWNLFFTPEGREVYRRIIGKMVERSKVQPFYNRERVWEITWEPELSVPSPKKLVEACEFARGIIKAADPEAKIALPTVSGLSHLDFYQKIFPLGILRSADVFDMHFYSSFPPEQSGYLRGIRSVIRMVRENGGGNLPLIATEGGYNAKATKEEEFKQMTGVVRMLLILLGEGFEYALPFYGSDYGGDYADRAEGDYGITYNLELPKVRFLPKKVSPRPIFATLSGFAMMVDGSRPTACLESLGDCALGYAYQAKDGTVTLALWAWDAKPVEIDLPVGVDRVDLGDVMGNVRQVATSDGNLRLSLGETPVYVKGVSQAYWGKDGTMSAKMAAAAKARAEAADRARRLEIKDVVAAASDGSPAVAVTIGNRRDETVEVAVSTRIRGVPDARRRVVRRIPPQAVETVKVVLEDFKPDPFLMSEMEVAAELPDGYRVETVKRINFLAADHLPGVGRNGDFSGWREIRWIDLPRNIRRKPELVKDERDLSAKMALGWNRDFFLLAFEVTDDDFMNEREAWWSWSGDAVQVAFAKAALDRPTDNVWADALEQAMTENTFALTPKGPQVSRTVSYDPARYPCDIGGDACLVDDARLSVVKTGLPDGGVRLSYRMAFPWKYMNRTEGVAGETVRFAASVNDRDHGEPDISAISVFEMKKLAPRGFGSVYLKE